MFDEGRYSTSAVAVTPITLPFGSDAVDHRPYLARISPGSATGNHPKTKRPGSGGTKTEKVIALLQKPRGATLKMIMHATGWQPHSVRGFISGQLTKKMGLHVRSFKREGERVYALKVRSKGPATD